MPRPRGDKRRLSGPSGGGGGGGRSGGDGMMMSSKSRKGSDDYFAPSLSNSRDDALNWALIQRYNNNHPHQQQIARYTQQAKIGFQGYNVETVDPFPGFHHIVIAYCLLAFVLMYPFVVGVRYIRETRKRNRQSSGDDVQHQHQKQQPQQQGGDNAMVPPPPTTTGNDVLQSSAGGGTVSISDPSSGGKTTTKDSDTTYYTTSIVVPPEKARSLCSSAPRYEDGEGGVPNHQAVPVTPTTTKSTFQEEPTPLSDYVPTLPPVEQQQQQQQLSSRSQQLHQACNSNSNNNPHHHHHQHHHQQQQSRQASNSQVASSSGILSRIPSAATTGRLHSSGMMGRGSTAAAWPRPRGRHSRRPSGDPSWQWRRAIQTERRHNSKRMEELLAQRGLISDDPNDADATAAAAAANNNSVLFGRLKNSAAGMMSDLANSVLTAEHKDFHQQQQQQAKLNQQKPQRVSRSSSAPVPPHHLPMPLSNSEAALYSRNNNKAAAAAMSSGVMRHRSSSSSKPHHYGMVARRPSHNGSARSGSLRSWGPGGGGGAYSASVMSSIVDDISPNDAADADDPGKLRIFPDGTSPNGGGAGAAAHHRLHTHRSPMAAACCMALEPWLDVAEPNEEWKRLMGLAFPVTVGAMVEPVSRCILTAMLSQWVGTHAMVAFLLVHLLYRMTGETLSVAITDAESTLVQMALTTTATNPANQVGNNNNSPTFTKEGYTLAGQYVQLGCLFQLIIVGTILLVWYLVIEDVILWWVDSEDMALLTKEYYQIILILFLVQSLYRAIIVPCHMRGSEHSTIESIMDIVVNAVTLITIVAVLSKTSNIPSEYPEVLHSSKKDSYSVQERLDDSRTALVTTAWIQVNIGIAACVLKVAFCVLKGWLDNFWVGLLRSLAVLNFEAFCNLLLTSIPLIFGAMLELGEVDLLTLFVQAIGPAEVATWAIFASMWDVLEASTEGISEAAAIRVAYHLSASQPALAKKLAHKSLFWTVVQALIYTSLLLLAGRHIIVALTVDYTLQHLLDQLIGLMALANLSMSFAQVCWSLVGAQGRFNLATLVMLVCRWLVTMPLSIIFIFALNYDEETLAGSVAVGTSTAACILATILFSSNWNDVAQELYLQGLLLEDDDDFDFSFGDDFDDDSDEDEDDEDDDDEDSLGKAPSGYPSNKKSMDEDSGDLPLSTEPTTRTGTNTGSGVNSGADSGVVSGGTISGVSGS